MIRPALRPLAIPVILTALTACDNVSWEGIDVGLQAPPSAGDTADVDTLTGAPDEPPPLDLGPVLYLVEREDGAGTFQPVAEIAGGGLRPLPLDRAPDFAGRFREERASPGTRLALFAAGARVGTLHTVGPAPPDTTLCAPRPRSRGRVELVPEAVDASPLLAVDGEDALSRPLGDYEPRAHTRDERVTSLNVAATVFNRLGAPWPADLAGSRVAIETFVPEGLSRESPAIAATFLFRDRPRIGPAPPSAWSIFIVSEPTPGGYQADHVAYRTAGEAGKGIPRYLQHADWDGDGRSNLLLEALGSERRWFEALERRPDGWTPEFRDPCGEPDVQGAAPSSGP